MVTIASQSGVIPEAARSSAGENGSRLRSLLEWERTFLAEQQWQQARLAADAGRRSVAEHPAGDGSLPGEERGTQEISEASSARGVTGVPGEGEAAAGEARPAPAPGRIGGVPVCDGAAAAGAGRELRGQAAARAYPLQRTFYPSPLSWSAPQPGALVRVDGETAQVWLRQPGGEASCGVEIVMQLKDLLARTGLRLQRFTVNGVLKWSADEEQVAVRESDPDGACRINRKV